MQFDKLIYTLLNERYGDTMAPSSIPALDGEKEFYYIYIDERQSPTQLKRARSEWWDKHDDVTVVEDYQQAIRKFKDQSRRIAWAKNSDDRLADFTQYIIKKLQPLKDLPGTWRVLSSDGDYVDSFTKGGFIVGFEVDTTAIRQTQIQSELEDIDTTGFEDLL